jgi:hypothetical protein
MNLQSWLLWGFIATVMLTTFSSLSQGLRFSRMNIPYMVGTMFTPDRDRARLYGFLFHLAAGWIFSLVYVLIFESLRRTGLWLGIGMGLFHAIFVLVFVVTVFPGIHPRMASERHGPEAKPMLEPPGFLALNYGARTPLAVCMSHAIFGAILGSFYQLK